MKKAKTAYPVLEIIAARWSPYGFTSESVSVEELCSLFEAARWAASSYNEQPWSYLVATQENKVEFGKALSCLTEPNQKWASTAPVLAFGIAKSRFTRHDRPNRVALHDLGLASASLVLEATSRGIYVHQMAGIRPDRIREIYQVPEEHEVVTGLAIGHVADAKKLPELYRQRDLTPRTRKPLSQFVFEGSWGAACNWTK